jgi:hypothetical protein
VQMTHNAVAVVSHVRSPVVYPWPSSTVPLMYEVPNAGSPYTNNTQTTEAKTQIVQVSGSSQI